jgi:hypothetical protein
MPLLLSTALKGMPAEDKQIILECFDENFAVINIHSSEARVALLLTIKKNYFGMFQYLLEQGVVLMNVTELPNAMYGYRANFSEPFKEAIQNQRIDMVTIITGTLVAQYDPTNSDYCSVTTILQKAKYASLGLAEEQEHSIKQRAAAREELSESQKTIERMIDNARHQIKRTYEAYEAKKHPKCAIM